MKRLCVAIIVLFALSGCSIVTKVNRPADSSNAYINSDNNFDYTFKSDIKPEHEYSVSEMPIPVIIKDGKEELDAADVFKESIKSELTARGFTVDDASTKNTVTFKDYQVISNRVSGFSPMVTLTFARVDVVSGDQHHSYKSFVKRAKVPVWSMNELNEPCYSEPLSLSIKTIAAQINRDFLHGKLPDEKVAELVAHIDQSQAIGSTYLDVYELGFSNNKTAIPALKKYTQNKHEYIRLAAISALGTLQDESSVAMLINIHKDSNMWQDRAMAIKSLIDINNTEAKSYVDSLYQTLMTKKSKLKDPKRIPKELRWNILLLEKYGNYSSEE
ncbi:hypothetical protein VHA01S_008_00700 [Vibrio halioticoli NBRC 102217]|uniref:HEAT repeat domain-containing protein n=1 Tax=Vibrio halioticoli NBRC 102217 TaxID=1219072 RepID=V5F0M8_9VIBR|nr:HEAT repeat domain-containing protein [Vibrio halioticoli]GAD88674.1 hypothetical protein VHA01S_008_00700 [Vibrio halioticoli NBRC 102217]